MEQTLQQKLKAKGINSLSDLNPKPFYAPTPEYDLEVDDIAPLPIDEIPRDFTDDDHQARNALLPKAPTRFQFLNGLIRSFNLKLAAEDYEHHYPPSEPEIGPKTRVLMVLAQVLRNNAKIQVFGASNGNAADTLASKHHQTTLFWYKRCMTIRANPLYRFTAILSILATATLIFTFIQPVFAAQVAVQPPTQSVAGDFSFSRWERETSRPDAAEPLEEASHELYTTKIYTGDDRDDYLCYCVTYVAPFGWGMDWSRGGYTRFIRWCQCFGESQWSQAG